MSRYINRTSLNELIKQNIRDLEKDAKTLEKIEERIETKHMNESSKLILVQK